jgi:hypothetical protein
MFPVRGNPDHNVDPSKINIYENKLMNKDARKFVLLSITDILH